MFSLVFGLISFLLDIFKLLVIVHGVLMLVKLPANKWTTLLASVMEPLLNPLRLLLSRYLPRNWQIADWSPLAMLILVAVVQWVLRIAGWILP